MPYTRLSRLGRISHLFRLGKSALFRRRIVSSAFSGKVALQPLDQKLVHPAFYGHIQHLMPLTLVPRPGAIMHFINRRYKLFPGQYIAEPEHIFAVAPLGFKYHFDIERCMTHIQGEIDRNKLQRIVFQSHGALETSQRFMTAPLLSHSSVVQIVPPEIEDLHPESLQPQRDQKRVLMITGRPYSKGLFMVPKILKEVRRQCNVRFICVCAQYFSAIANLEGCELIVTPRLSDEQRRDLYTGADLFLNLSLMESLGVCLECIRFNTPMVTLRGQHSESFIKATTGVIIDTPLYFLDQNCGTTWRNEREFVEIVQRRAEEGLFDGTVERVTSVLLKLLSEDELLLRMKLRQHQYASMDLTVAGWLEQWHQLYIQVSDDLRSSG